MRKIRHLGVSRAKSPCSRPSSGQKIPRSLLRGSPKLARHAAARNTGLGYPHQLHRTPFHDGRPLFFFLYHLPRRQACCEAHAHVPSCSTTARRHSPRYMYCLSDVLIHMGLAPSLTPSLTRTLALTLLGWQAWDGARHGDPGHQHVDLWPERDPRVRWQVSS